MNKLVIAVLLFFLAHALTWLQMNMQFVNEWFRTKHLLMSLFGIPIAYFFIKGISYIQMYYGAIWPGRIIGFCIGNLVFGTMTYLLLNEGINAKTGISLVLSLAIILIQVFWK